MEANCRLNTRQHSDGGYSAETMTINMCLRCQKKSTRVTMSQRSWPSLNLTVFLMTMSLSLLLELVDCTCQRSEVITGYVPNDHDRRNKYQPHTQVQSMAQCVRRCCEDEDCNMAWIVTGNCFTVKCVEERLCGTQRSSAYPDSQMVYVSTVTECIPGYKDCDRDRAEVCLPAPQTPTSHYTCQCRDGFTRGVLGDCVRSTGNEDSYPDDAANWHNYFGRGADGEDNAPMTTQALLDGYKMCYRDADCKPQEFCFGLPQFDKGVCAPESIRDVDAPTDPEPSATPSQGSDLQTPSPVSGVNESSIVDPPPTLKEVPQKKDGQGDGSSSSLGLSPDSIATGSTHNLSESVDTNSSAILPSAQPTSSSKSDGSVPSLSLSTEGPPDDGSGNTSSGNHSIGVDHTTSANLHAPSSSPLARSTAPASTSVSVPATTTSPTTSTTSVSHGTPPFLQLVVSLGESKILHLPEEDSVRLHAYVVPATPPNNQPYTYEYRVMTVPDESRVEMTSPGQNDPKVQLSHLTAGFYQFQVTVTGLRCYGTDYVNVTVVPPPRINQPPVAIIQPDVQVVTLPNSDTILDGSGSTDDDNNRIASYSWEQVQGPIGNKEISGDQDTLQLINLVPGVYLIKLTVVDFDGASNSTIANVTVKEEDDYKPHANAGPDVEIKLPVDFATLNGSKSSDDHGIETYEWSKLTTDKVADMTGSSSKILHLTDLEEGTYVFKLTVTDRTGQKDSDTATVIVKPEKNIPPTADAGPDKELSLPDDATELDGSDSVDDLGIIHYLWEQVSGPSDASLTNADQARVSVSDLQEGTYVFKLTVTDGQGASDSSTVSVAVKREINKRPTAVAGPDQDLTLPKKELELDGTQSSDDKGIVSYHWTRSSNSPAAGVVIGNSHRKAVLRMVDLVPGTYTFTLNVTDAKGAFGIDTVTVTVHEDPNLLSLVQIIFDENIQSFTEQNKKDLVLPLAVMLGVGDGDVVLQRITHTNTNMLKVIFYALNDTSHTPLPGPVVLNRLKSKGIMSQKALLKYGVLEYDTMVCQKNCSNHGHCDVYTKKCVCETFWMQNFFRVKFGDGESNCDWSILYVIIVCFLVLVTLGAFIWLLTCCIARRKKKGNKKRHRYTLLDEQDDHELMDMLPKVGNGKQSSSIMVSESGDDSDDETTVFEIKRQDRNGSKPPNGYVHGKHRSKRPSHRTEKL